MKIFYGRLTNFGVVLAVVLLVTIIFKKHQHPHHEQISVIAQTNHAGGIAVLHSQSPRASAREGSGTASPLDCPSEQELKEFPGARVIEFAEVDGPEPGQKIRMRILETKYKYPYVRIEEVMEPLTNRVVSREEMVADHLLASLPEGEDPSAFFNKLGSQVVSMERISSNQRLYQLQLAKNNLAALPQMLDEIRQNKLAAAISEPDFFYHVCSIPNDSLYHQQWYLWKSCNGVDGQIPSKIFFSGIDAPDAWDVRTSAASVIVAVIDSGIRYTHEDLAANMWHNPVPTYGDIYGCNAVAKNGDPMDDLGHGTFCAGIIGAAGNNGKGIAGVAWTVQLMACKNINAQGDAVTSDNITCINYACDHGAKILNCSWDSRGHAFYSASERAAFQYAHDQGVIVVASVGDDGINDDVNKDDYPTCYGFDNIIAVASTNAANELSNFSSYGATTVHLAAPGEEIISTYNASDSSYNYGYGTSFAAPQVTGTLALMKEQFPTLSYQDLIAQLLAATDKIPSLQGKVISGGRLNVAKALGADM